MKVSGRCSCEYVRYEAQVDENIVVVCHCTNCQRHSGSPFRVAVSMDLESFALLSGELNSYQKIADSGSLRDRPFCPRCGTNFYATTLGEGFGFTGLRIGTIDQRDQLTPRLQIWCRSAQPWAILDSIPRFEKQPSVDEMRKLCG